MKKYMEYRTGYIYKIQNPKGRVYIGKTIDLKTRMSRYRLCLCKVQLKLFNSIKFHGWKAHSVEILQKGLFSNEQLNSLEKKYIQDFDSFRNGLNMTHGGDGSFGRVASTKHRALISIAKKGTKLSEHSKLLMSLARKGVKKPAGFGKMLSIALSGRKFTKEHRNNLSISHKNIIPHNRKKVINKADNTVFMSGREASVFYGIKYSTLRSRLKKSNTDLIYL